MSKEVNSNWIWLNKDVKASKDEPILVNFRKELFLESQSEGQISISADSRYKLYINSHLVEVGPSKGDAQVWFKDEIDITPYLTEGKNIIAVKVLRYPLDHLKGNHGVYRTHVPGLYLTGELKNKNEEMYLQADESWKVRIDESFKIYPEAENFYPLNIYEQVKGSKENIGWMTAQYDDSEWEQARIYKYSEVSEAISPGNLYKRTIPYMYRKYKQFDEVVIVREGHNTPEKWRRFIKESKDITIPSNSTEIVEISAGELTTGYLSLQMLAGKGAKIELLQSEAYCQDETTTVNGLTIPIKKDRTDFINGHLEGFTDYYTVAGYGKEGSFEIFEPYWFRTFRFIQLKITTSEEPITLSSFDYLETGYPLEVKTSVKTSDESLQNIWGISERTLRRCMHETYEDCPFYEQLQYAMDSRSQMLFTYSISADDRLARKTMDDFKRSQRYDGTLNASYPNTGPNVIPGFSIYYILMVYDHMMYFGDETLINHHFPTIEKILNYFENNLNEHNYLNKLGGLNGKNRYWSFIDWTEEWNKTSGVPDAILDGPITMESLLYIIGLQAAEKIANYSGKVETAKSFSERAEKVRKAIRLHSMGSNGMIQDGPGVDKYSQHAQVFGILTETLTESEGKVNLSKTLVDSDEYAQCSVAMSYYLFRALEKTNLYDETDKLWNIWRKMLANNVTTTVEAEAGERSECHAWGALALYELPSLILGVRPAEPGYKSIKIEPLGTYLDWAEGTVVTPVGDVTVKWIKTEAGVQLEYVVPEGIKVYT